VVVVLAWLVLPDCAVRPPFMARRSGRGAPRPGALRYRGADLAVWLAERATDRPRTEALRATAAGGRTVARNSRPKEAGAGDRAVDSTRSRVQAELSRRGLRYYDAHPAERIRHAEWRFGDVTLNELERMVDQIAGWQAKQPRGIRYDASRHWFASDLAIEPTLFFTPRLGRCAGHEPGGRDDGERQAAQASAAVARGVAGTRTARHRPARWCSQRASHRLVRRDRRTGKTNRRRLQVSPSPRALAALDAVTPRLDTLLLFPSPGTNVLNLNNFRKPDLLPGH
jgi:hypothetical protein